MPDESGQSDVVFKTANSSRCVILHYHLFKNAGTSLDNFLKENFADQWRNHESKSGKWQSENVGQYLNQNRNLRVLSSHKAQLPVPEVPETLVFPVLFVRHPIDRVRSIYQFERNQNVNSLGARMAKKLLQFIGLVEQFDESIENLLALLKPYFPEPAYTSRRDNVTQQAGTTLKDRLYNLQEQIGLKLYDELVQANELDLAIHRSITSRYTACQG